MHIIQPQWFIAMGNLLSGLAHLLYAIRQEGSIYWTNEFFGQLLSYATAGLGKRYNLGREAFAAGSSPTRFSSPVLPLASNAGFICVAKEAEPTEVAAATACLQFWSIFGGACGIAFSIVVYTNVGDLDVGLLGVTDDARYKEDLLRGLRASFWLWAGLCFSSKSKRSP